MTTGEKIAKLRRENNYTQEQLAEILSISRQSVSKYESGLAYPETEKIIRLSELFDCTLDYLLKDEVIELKNNNISNSNNMEEGLFIKLRHRGTNFSFEKKSEHVIFGMPLWHIGKNARGFIAIGLRAKGVIAIGAFSLGVVSVGMFSAGILSLGLFTLGVLSAGCISVGAMSLGAISVGIVSIGAIAIGEFSIGALAIGHYFAYGDYARGMFAFGERNAFGTIFEKVGELNQSEKKEAFCMMQQKIPGIYQWIVNLLNAII